MQARKKTQTKELVKDLDSFLFGAWITFIITALVFAFILTQKFVSRDSIEKTGLISINGITYRVEKNK